MASGSCSSSINHPQLCANHSTRDSKSVLHRTYAQVVKDCSPTFSSQSSQFLRPQSSKKRWIDSRSNKFYCFRCGDRNHYASHCREPIKCFQCGKFGHKSFNCSSVAKSPVSSEFLVENGFQFVLKIMLLKAILLDHLWQFRVEGLNFLEDMLLHFNVVNAPNIGKGYKARFGDPDSYFGKSDSFSVSSYTSDILAEHGFLFVLKFIYLRVILINNLRFKCSDGLKLLDDLLNHFNNVNLPNTDKGFLDFPDVSM